MQLGRGKTPEFNGKAVGLVILAVALLILVPVPILLASCSFVPKASLILAGSTSVQPFAEILAEDYMKLHPEVTIDVQGGGSAAGIMAASSGIADVGMCSRALSGDEKKLWYVEIAKDGLALIVNPRNPVSSLTLAQARDIYAGATSQWSAFGGPHSGIHVVAREDGSGTRSAFESMVMGNVQITPRAIIQDSNGAVRQVVADDLSAIGFISLGLVDSQVKAVKLGDVAATEDNIINGSYGLFRPFLLISRGNPAGQARQFIDFALSDAGRQILDAEGLITSGGSSGK